MFLRMSGIVITMYETKLFIVTLKIRKVKVFSVLRKIQASASNFSSNDRDNIGQVTNQLNI